MKFPVLLRSSPLLAMVVACACGGSEECLPSTRADGADLRDQPHLVVQVGHSFVINSAEFSPDGRQILTGSYDRTARLWDVATGAEVRRFQGHGEGDGVAAAFSPDGRRVVTAGGFTARFWDPLTGSELRCVKMEAILTSAAFSPDGHYVLLGGRDGAHIWEPGTDAQPRPLGSLRPGSDARWITSVAVSPDGRFALTADLDEQVVLWDVETGTEVRTLLEDGDAWSVAFSPDGRHALTGGEDGWARLWEIGTGSEVQRFGPHEQWVVSVAFSPDGRRVLTGTGGATQMWDMETGAELGFLEGEGDPVAVSPRGDLVLTGGRGHAIRLWDCETGSMLGRFEGRVWRRGRVTLSADGSRALIVSSDEGSAAGATRSDYAASASLWDLRSGTEIRRLVWDSELRDPVATLSPDGRRLLRVTAGSGATLWDLESGVEIRRFEGHDGEVRSVAFSPDGRLVATGGTDGTARIWDANSGVELQRLRGHTDRVIALAFSPDGRRVVTGSRDYTARIWDPASGRELQLLPGHADACRRGLAWFRLVDCSVLAVAFSPDGGRVLTAGLDGPVRLWDVDTGNELLRFRPGTDAVVGSVAFAPGGRTVLTATWGGVVYRWDSGTGAELGRLTGRSWRLVSVAFSPGGEILTGSPDGTVRLWDSETRAELARLISFTDGSWAVVDPSGRYDASNGGDVEGLHWVVGLEPVELHQLKERYYEPGLLAKVMGFNDEPRRDVRAFRDVELYPEVELAAAPTAADPSIRFTLRNRGGGIGRVVVSLNGRELTPDARPEDFAADSDSLTLSLDVAGSPYLLPGDSNLVEVRAFNDEGYLSSRRRGFEVMASGSASGGDGRDPRLWAVVAGVSDYTGDAIDLRFAAKDAADVAGALQLAGENLFGADRTRVMLLSRDGGTGSAPTRRRLVAALEALADSAAATDVVVVYLAGHGVVHGGAEGDYYYLASEARSADLTDPAVRYAVAISSAELSDLLLKIPALKQVLILDTCGAGRAVETLAAARDIPSSQVRAIQRMKDRTGMYVLAGSAADAVSYEASRYTQGVLTYSLLMGLRGAALRDGEFVDVARLFHFAVDEVPRLAGEIGGIQQPELATPRGGQSFDIGRLPAEDRSRIPLAEARPLVLRAVFQDERPPFTDRLGLGEAVNDRLRDVSARARGEGAVVFVDATELPGAHKIAGRYTVEGERVTVSGFVVRGQETLGTFEVVGAMEDVRGLAALVAERARQLIP